MAVRSEAGLVSGIKLEQVDEQIRVCVCMSAAQAFHLTKGFSEA